MPKFIQCRNFWNYPSGRLVFAGAETAQTPEQMVATKQQEVGTEMTRIVEGIKGNLEVMTADEAIKSAQNAIGVNRDAALAWSGDISQKLITRDNATELGKVLDNYNAAIPKMVGDAFKLIEDRKNEYKETRAAIEKYTGYRAAVQTKIDRVVLLLDAFTGIKNLSLPDDGLRPSQKISHINGLDGNLAVLGVVSGELSTMMPEFDADLQMLGDIEGKLPNDTMKEWVKGEKEKIPKRKEMLLGPAKTFDAGLAALKQTATPALVSAETGKVEQYRNTSGGLQSQPKGTVPLQQLSDAYQDIADQENYAKNVLPAIVQKVQGAKLLTPAGGNA